MSELSDDIKAAFEAYKANVDAKIAAQADSIAALQLKVSALPPDDSAALQADLDEINAANAALTTPVAVPATPEPAAEAAPAPETAAVEPVSDPTAPTA